MAESPGPLLSVVEGDIRTPVEGETLVMDLGHGKEVLVTRTPMGPHGGSVHLRAGPDMTKLDAVKLMAGLGADSSNFVVRLGACNVVHVAIDPGRRVLAR